MRSVRCDFGSFWTYDGETFSVVAMHGVTCRTRREFADGQRPEPGASHLTCCMRGEAHRPYPGSAEIDELPRR